MMTVFELITALVTTKGQDYLGTPYNPGGDAAVVVCRKGSNPYGEITNVSFDTFHEMLVIHIDEGDES
jgi:hypothetical protein